MHGVGDVYDGEWIDDKANGKGMYIHMDESTYIGDWIDD